MRKLVRALLTLATFIVVWLVASPARAAAPICDPRGAIGFAPPPQMQDPEQSLDVVAPKDCDESPLDVRAVVPGHSSGIDVSSSQEPATSSQAAVPPPAPGSRLAAPRASPAAGPSGVLRSLERPPRA